MTNYDRKLTLTIASWEGDLTKSYGVWVHCQNRQWRMLYPVAQLAAALEMGDLSLLRAVNGELMFPMPKQQKEMSEV